MKRMFAVLSAGVLVIALVLNSCAPKSAPTATAPVAPSPSVTPTAIPAATTASPEEAAWQKIVTSAQNEGKVVIYTPIDLVGETGRAVTAAFKDKYGITLDVLVSTAPAITEKIQAEAKQGQYVGDIIISGSVSIPRLVMLGLGQDVSKDLPVLKDRQVFRIPPVFSPEGQVLTYSFSPMAMIVNSKLVDKGEIQSYYDLLAPKWKGGKIILVDPRLGSSSPMLSITQMRMQKALDDAYFSRFAEQKPNLWAGASAEAVNMVARGEFAINYEAIPSLFLSALREGAPIRVLHLKEGSIGMPNTIMVTKNAPHPNAARLFLSWFLSAEGQTVFDKASGNAPLRTDVSDFSYPAASEDPIKKLLPTTWEISLKTIEEVNANVMEKFFGKR